MFEIVKNTLSRWERSRAKKKELENPREKTPFQAWSDEHRALASRVENALHSKPEESGLAQWRVECLDPLMKDLLDFKDRWDKHVGDNFSSRAVIDIDALLARAKAAEADQSDAGA